MPYEIPQQLQYEEKIIFGLTFKQLLFAILFLGPAIIIFFKTHLNIYVKSAFAAILAFIAILFMFFDISSYFRNMFHWMRFREVSIMDLKMIQFLGLEKIENGVVYVSKNKKLVAVSKIPKQ